MSHAETQSVNNDNQALIDLAQTCLNDIGPNLAVAFDRAADKPKDMMKRVKLAMLCLKTALETLEQVKP